MGFLHIKTFPFNLPLISMKISQKISMHLILLFLGIPVSFNHQIAQAQTPVAPPTTAKYTCPAQLESSI
jgi:hypothetical protein